VRLHGTRAEVQAQSDLAVREPLARQAQDVDFAVRENALPRCLRGGLPGRDAPQHLGRHAGIEHRFAGAHASHCVDDLARTRVLEQVPGRSCLQNGKDVLIVIVRRQDENRGPRTNGLDPLGSLDAVHDRHADVHNGHVGMLARRESDGLTAVARLGDHGQVCLPFQDAAGAFAHEHVIIGEQDTYGRHRDLVSAFRLSSGDGVCASDAWASGRVRYCATDLGRPGARAERRYAPLEPIVRLVRGAVQRGGLESRTGGNGRPP